MPLQDSRTPDSIRLVALVRGFPGPRKTTHTWRQPDGSEVLMPLADVVFLEATPGAGAQLYRYTVAGEFCGDSWFHTVDDAKDQAAFEYGRALGPWEAVPAGEADGYEYSVRLARASL